VFVAKFTGFLECFIFILLFLLSRFENDMCITLKYLANLGQIPLMATSVIVYPKGAS